MKCGETCISPGGFQSANAALAVASGEQLLTCGFCVDEDHIRNGLEALLDSLHDRFGDLSYHVFLAVRPDKALRGMLRILGPVTELLTVAGTSRQLAW